MTIEVVPTAGTVEAVSVGAEHTFSKTRRPSVELVEGLGVAGDTHAGVTVQHRSRVAKDPTQPNLRQVHLIHGELLDELQAQGFDVAAGSMGENVTTRGVDLLALPRGTRLRLGGSALLEVTGLRNPCSQLNDHEAGLMKAVLDTDSEGRLVRKAGIMAVVLASGTVEPGDQVAVELPDPPHLPLEPV